MKVFTELYTLKIPFNWPWKYLYTSNIPFIYGSRKVCKVCNFWGFKIQDSGKNFLNPSADWHGALDDSQGLDSGSFSQNLESWTQESVQNLQIFGTCFRVCVCMCLPRFVDSTHMPVYMNVFIYLCIYIYYIYMVPPFT